jgi:hypothetical protein
MSGSGASGDAGGPRGRGSPRTVQSYSRSTSCWDAQENLRRRRRARRHARRSCAARGVMPRALRPSGGSSSRRGQACQVRAQTALPSASPRCSPRWRGGSREQPHWQGGSREQQYKDTLPANRGMPGTGPCARAAPRRARGARQQGRAGSGNAHRRSPTRCAPNVMQRTCACGQAAAANVAASRARAPPSANPATTTRAGASPPDTSRAACAPRPPGLASASRGAHHHRRREPQLAGAPALASIASIASRPLKKAAPDIASEARVAVA